MFQVGLQPGGYLLAVVTGATTLPAYRGIAAMIAEYCRTEPQDKVLVDLLGAKPEMDEADHRALGEFLGTAAQGLQIAVVVPAVERVGTGEQVAQVSGADLRTFTSLPEAEAWLLGRKPPA